MKATIYDVAKEANVSLATVSRVLNNPDKVKPATKKRVIEAIEKLNYRPNAIARGLASKKSTTVGLIVPDVSRQSISEVTKGISDVANMYKYTLLLANTNYSLEEEKHVWYDVLATQVDGILFMADEITDEHRKLIQNTSIPVVLISCVDELKEIPSVNIDYSSSIYSATQELIEKGHSNIVYISGKRSSSVNRLKEEGFVRAMAENSLKYEDKIIRIEEDNDLGIETFSLYLDRNKPTAVVSGRDTYAISFLNVAQNKGISVPDEIEIVGFSNSKLAKLSRPQLTSISQSIYDIGAVAMRLLTKLMNNEPVQEKVVVLPTSRTIYRGTTKNI